MKKNFVQQTTVTLLIVCSLTVGCSQTIPSSSTPTNDTQPISEQQVVIETEPSNTDNIESSQVSETPSPTEPSSSNQISEQPLAQTEKLDNLAGTISREQRESISDQTPVESKNLQQENCTGIIVARAGDYEIYYFDSNELTKLYIHVFENLRSMALRNEAGISGILQTTDDSVYSILSAAEETITTDIIDQGYISSDVKNNITWVRLLYNPYIPEIGVNDQPHKDIVFAITGENLEDAYLIIQDPKASTVWNYMELEEYGQWLNREIDMLLAQTTGF